MSTAAATMFAIGRPNWLDGGKRGADAGGGDLERRGIMFIIMRDTYAHRLHGPN